MTDTLTLLRNLLERLDIDPGNVVSWAEWDAVRDYENPACARDASPPSDAVLRASVDEIADAMVWAILEGTFQTEEAARHAVYELVGKVRAQPAECPHCVVEHRWPCPTIPRCDEPGCICGASDD